MPCSQLTIDVSLSLITINELFSDLFYSSSYQERMQKEDFLSYLTCQSPMDLSMIARLVYMLSLVGVDFLRLAKILQIRRTFGSSYLRVDLMCTRYGLRFIALLTQVSLNYWLNYSLLDSRGSFFPSFTFSWLLKIYRFISSLSRGDQKKPILKMELAKLRARTVELFLKRMTESSFKIQLDFSRWSIWSMRKIALEYLPIAESETAQQKMSVNWLELCQRLFEVNLKHYSKSYLWKRLTAQKQLQSVQSCSFSTISSRSIAYCMFFESRPRKSRYRARFWWLETRHPSTFRQSRQGFSMNILMTWQMFQLSSISQRREALVLKTPPRCLRTELMKAVRMFQSDAASSPDSAKTLRVMLPGRLRLISKSYYLKASNTSNFMFWILKPSFTLAFIILWKNALAWLIEHTMHPDTAALNCRYYLVLKRCCFVY